MHKQILNSPTDPIEPQNLNHIPQQQQLVIASTFTAEPIEPFLTFWMQELNIPTQIEFAPYNQIFQQLLDPASLFLKNQGGLNIILIRFEDWQRFEDSADTKPPANTHKKIQGVTQDLINALKSAAKHSAVPYLVCLCPAAPVVLTNPNQRMFFEQLEETLVSELNSLSGVYAVTSSVLFSTYPVAAYYDSYADKLGHIPFTPTFFSALATMITRSMYATLNAPPKALVLDCDQTLWGGVCAEDGAFNLQIDSSWQAIQKFMLAQYQAGMLLCLCSKNNQADVFDVFDHRVEMILKREHIVSWRINWLPKSENIKSLAKELQLGLDSFVFIDDNPIECAEVQTNCPEVLTFQLPPVDQGRNSKFLEHIWAFDRLKITKEDQQRSAFYRQNIQREQLRRYSMTFDDFLDSLDLQVQISEMKPPQIPRISQLTDRTNQFNATTIRRSEREIQRLAQAEGFQCLAVEVSDRFGDYGLVGVVVFKMSQTAIKVDTFLLSCRVLGRGVEHKIVAKLGKIAKECGLGQVNVPYIPSKRNQPILDFLEDTGAEYKIETATGFLFQFPPEVAASLTYRPNLTEAKPQSPAKLTKQAASISKHRPGTSAKSALLTRIATELYDAEQILKVIESQPRQARPDQLSGNYAAPRTALEQLLADMWQDVLQIERVGIYDDFLALGGDSIKGAILINNIQKQLQEFIYIVALFDAPTIAKLATYLSEHYPEATAGILGTEINRQTTAGPNEKINAAKVAQLRQLMPALPKQHQVNPTKNPPAIFILSPPRSGSTLLRVILAGHPQLFAPPELELLSFSTLAERKAVLSGRDNFFLEGAIRAIMQIKDCRVEQAQRIVQEYEDQHLSTRQFYRLMQQWLKDRTLVDKSITYTLDLEILKRAESGFEEPLYIHLLRYPYGMIHSFEKVRLDQIFFRYDHPFSRRELAELIWIISNQNTLEFFKQIPPHRQCRLKFEDMVNQPHTHIRDLCKFLKLDFHPEMLQPYEEKKQRMTDGLYPISRMIGDPKFHQHSNIEAGVANKWKEDYTIDFLGDLTWQMAESFGYKRIQNGQNDSRSDSITRVSRGNAEQLLTQLDQLSDEEVAALLKDKLAS